MEAVGFVLLVLGFIQLVLILAKYRDSRPLRLGLYSTMFAASGWRALLSHLRGQPFGLLDGFTLTFFAIAAVMEASAVLRQRSKRR